jgi:GAF domain-containing protein
VKLGEGITGTVAATGEIIIASDVDNDPYYAFYDALPDVKVELCVPLTIHDKVIGIIDVKSNRENGLGEEDAEFIKILAAQVSVAVQNAQHFSVLQERTREISGLYEMAIATTSVLEPKQLFQRLYEQILRLMHPDVCIAALTVGNGETLTLALYVEQGASFNTPLPTFITIEESGLIGWVLESQEILTIDDLQADPLPTTPRLSPNARSWIGVPLLIRDRSIGVLCVQSYEPNAFSSDQYRFLQSAARQVAIAVENARLYRSAIDTAQRFEILRQASQEILSAGLDPVSVYEAIHRATKKLMPSEAFVISKVDELTQQIHVVYAVDRTGLVAHNPVPLGEGLSSHVIMTGNPVLASDIAQQDELDAIHFGDPESVRSVLAVPLRIGGKIFGMLSAQSYMTNAHTHQDQSMLEMLAAYAAAALENTRLFDREHQRNVELEALRLASLNLTSSLAAEEVLQLILQSSLSMVKADDAHIFLYDGERLSFGAARWRDQAQAKPFSNPRPQGVTYTVARTGKPLIIPTTKGHPMFKDTDWDSAIAGLPLVIGDLVVGVMNVAYHQAHIFDENELRSLRLLADQAAIAIRNAELFESTQRQLKELKLLYSLALSGAEATDENDLIEHATKHIGQTLYPDNFGVLLLNETEDMLYLHESYRCQKEGLHEHNIPLGDGITGNVALNGIPLRIADIRETPFAILLNEAMRSELCVPLRVGQRIIGVINAESTKIGFFTEDDERLLLTVGNQLATGIEKARLFDEITRALEREQRLNEITRTISGTLNIPTILNHVLKLATELIGAEGAILFMPTEDKTTISQPYVYNVAGEGQNLFLAERRGIVRQIIESNESLLLSNYEEHPDALDVLIQLGAHAFIGVPVAIGGSAIGVLEVYSTSEDVRFSQRDLGLIESIGLQTGIAIQNARHFEQASQRATELAAALSRLEELDQLKSEFIQNVSHELRTPLAIVRGYIELLTDGTLGEINPIQVDPINIISRRVDMLTHIVEDLTIILEVEGDRMRWEEIDIHELTKASISEFQVSMESAGLHLISETDSYTKPIYGDSVKLRRTLDNLIGNALKFTPKGGNITVKLQELGDSVLIQVSDTGIGIPKDKLERVFERFYQVDGSSRRRYGGTGLGLSLVKEITEAHNGKVSVVSEENKGTTFSIEIPHGSPEYKRVNPK